MSENLKLPYLVLILATISVSQAHAGLFGGWRNQNSKASRSAEAQSDNLKVGELVILRDEARKGFLDKGLSLAVIVGDTKNLKKGAEAQQSYRLLIIKSRVFEGGKGNVDVKVATPELIAKRENLLRVDMAQSQRLVGRIVLCVGLADTTLGRIVNAFEGGFVEFVPVARINGQLVIRNDGEIKPQLVEEKDLAFSVGSTPNGLKVGDEAYTVHSHENLGRIEMVFHNPNYQVKNTGAMSDRFYAFVSSDIKNGILVGTDYKLANAFAPPFASGKGHLCEDDLKNILVKNEILKR